MAGSLCSGESLAFIKNFYENLSFTVFVQYKKGQQEEGGGGGAICPLPPHSG